MAFGKQKYGKLSVGSRSEKIKKQKTFKKYIVFWATDGRTSVKGERGREESHQFCIGNESRQKFHHRRRRIKHVPRCNFGYQRPEEVRTNSRHLSLIVTSLVCQRVQIRIQIQKLPRKSTAFQRNRPLQRRL